MYTGVPGVFTSVWKNCAMSYGMRTQPCDTGFSGTPPPLDPYMGSPWMAYEVPMKNTELYIVPSGTLIQPGM